MWQSPGKSGSQNCGPWRRRRTEHVGNRLPPVFTNTFCSGSEHSNSSSAQSSLRKILVDICVQLVLWQARRPSVATKLLQTTIQKRPDHAIQRPCVATKLLQTAVQRYPDASQRPSVATKLLHVVCVGIATVDNFATPIFLDFQHPHWRSSWVSYTLSGSLVPATGSTARPPTPATG